ncbi:hypothetical protein FIBSPDRAFT_945779 [Athelia psychrophila]|uniref:Uncharacterized protein n=1 Tax=Athelia psychrophila TaxID=1759441 RepID=A0A166TQ80_9AGAM|nr:hypothetical protein FIBSPDRAFT_945779 [Fibularhizoctonia sp. CBS 109695]
MNLVQMSERRSRWFSDRAPAPTTEPSTHQGKTDSSSTTIAAVFKAKFRRALSRETGAELHSSLSLALWETSTTPSGVPCLPTYHRIRCDAAVASPHNEKVLESEKESGPPRHPRQRERPRPGLSPASHSQLTGGLLSADAR